MAEATSPEWQGKVSVGLKGATADQVWPFLEDFCGFDKLHPDADICRTVEGVACEPGLVRYYTCSEWLTPSGEAIWANEKLLVIDPFQRLLSYQIIDSNMGFKYYVGTMKVLAIEEEDQTIDGFKSVIEWSFVADPIEGWPLQTFQEYLNECIQFMAEKIKQNISSR